MDKSLHLDPLPIDGGDAAEYLHARQLERIALQDPLAKALEVSKVRHSLETGQRVRINAPHHKSHGMTGTIRQERCGLSFLSSETQ